MVALTNLKRLLPKGPKANYPRVYWLSRDLAISPEPADDDWPLLHTASIRVVLDLRAEAEDAAHLAEAHGLRYLRLPIVDGAAPSDASLRLITGWVIERINANGPVLVHCREGRGRSATVACAVLVKLGMPLPQAFAALRRARWDIVLTKPQMEALERFSTAQTT
ncbi:MAG TPA: dual specificity protein phosphatase family protein [Dehalococcoidia bacterium]|nr:dual specificity protein phosphatase family protein [Dehalococcoidia bacterium]